MKSSRCFSMLQAHLNSKFLNIVYDVSSEQEERAVRRLNMRFQFFASQYWMNYING
ncbi:hypothetical protein [Vibrio cholerae]|uniref:hypothetical protein n=1 Tax=Vibrio cholerae TaxID=666 RepID=UPI001F2055C0|nr:hypothetical protein [Vibrio cholerae]UIP05063.1 hypothetical protein LY388_10895 [Vibrio cholerae]